MSAYTPHSDGALLQLVPLAAFARVPDDVIRSQAERLVKSDVFKTLLDSIPDSVLVLNRQRQVVLSNQAATTAFGSYPMDILGWRPGDLLDCVHAKAMSGGCGTTEFCQTCGAARAIYNSLSGAQDVQDCRIVRNNGEAYDLRVWSRPLAIEDEIYSVITLQDISAEKRRDALQSIFFHDVLNLAGVLLGYADLLETTSTVSDQERVRRTLVKTSLRLIEEITMQRDLLTAEHGDLELCPGQGHSLRIITSVVERYRDHDVTRDCTLVIAPDADPVLFETDLVLVERVLGNLVKNALEASANGQTVTLSCSQTEHDVIFTVHNQCAMPRHVQLQVFQRSFSTKGEGRGLGTYSVKLLTEQYLGGTVSFTSSQEAGTRFFVTLPLAFPVARAGSEVE